MLYVNRRKEKTPLIRLVQQRGFLQEAQPVPGQETGEEGEARHQEEREKLLLGREQTDAATGTGGRQR